MTSALVVLLGAAVALWALPLETEHLFGGLLVHDGTGRFFGWLFLASAALAVLIAYDSPQIGTEGAGEFAALVLALTFGMFLLGGATDALVLYLALEAVSLPSYVLAGLKRHNRRSSEAALKYVIYGGVASGVMLYGISILYGLFGTTRLAGPGSIATQLATGLLPGTLGAGLGDPALRLLLALAFVFVLAGLAFKTAAAPFHQWSPDVYEGAPTPFSLLLSVGPKLAGFAALLRISTHALSQPSVTGGLAVSSLLLDWPALLGVLAFATLTVGTLGAFAQTNLKRLLAWSSISHAGYLLLGLAAGNQSGSRALLVYAAIYLILNGGAFAAVDAMSRSCGEELSDARGLGSRSPVLAGTFVVLLFGLIGVPPLAGFVGKVLLFGALVERGGAFGIGLAIAGVLYSAASLYVYARVVKELYFVPATSSAPVPLPRVHAVVLLSLTAVSLVLGVWWSPLASAAARALAP